MGRVTALSRVLRTPLAALLLFIACIDVSYAVSHAAATNNVLTFHASYTTCLTRIAHRTGEHPHSHLTPDIPRCTVSVRILRHSPHPTWQPVHNSTVLTAASPYFTYRIPDTQLRCHHQTVLRCVSHHSHEQLLVIPAAGFFHAPTARQPPPDTFVILDNVDCQLTTSTETTSSIRTYGFCPLGDRGRLHSPPLVPATSHNFSLPNSCPIQSVPHPVPHSRKRHPRPSRRATSEQATPAAPSLLTRILVWLYEHSRSGRTEQASYGKTSAILLDGEHEQSSVHALYSVRSWLLVLSSASVCSAAVLVWLIVRLTERIEMH